MGRELESDAGTDRSDFHHHHHHNISYFKLLAMYFSPKITVFFVWRQHVLLLWIAFTLTKIVFFTILY